MCDDLSVNHGVCAVQLLLSPAPAHPQSPWASSRPEPVVISPAVSDSAARPSSRLHLGLARAHAAESAGSRASMSPRPTVLRSSSAPVARGRSPLSDSAVVPADARPPVRWSWLQCAAGSAAGRGRAGTTGKIPFVRAHRVNASSVCVRDRIDQVAPTFPL